MRMSDVIEDFIKDLFDEDESDLIEIQRNELAQHFNCVPSQINYVISTRFKPSQGYYVESKRGGGGNIKIRKINNTKSDYIMHIINNVGKTITTNDIDILLSDFLKCVDKVDYGYDGRYSPVLFMDKLDRYLNKI